MPQVTWSMAMGFYTHKLKLQPYVSYQYRSIDARRQFRRFGLGVISLAGITPNFQWYNRSRVADTDGQGVLTRKP